MNPATKQGQDVMRNRTVRDEIDRELTRTFFGGAEKRTSAAPVAAAPPPPEKKLNIIPFAAAASIILIIGFVFFMNNRVIVSVKVQPKPPAPRVYRAVMKNDKKPAMLLSDYKYRPGALKASKDEKTLYDFEKDEQGWEIPSWETQKTDHVASYIKPVEKIASKGNGSLELFADFPGNQWTGALAEIGQFLDLSDYDRIAVDIYIPPSCPPNLKAKLILTVGDDWKFVEMARGVKLVPGKWNTISASISKGSWDWRAKVDDSFRQDVRKIALRVESERGKYSGPIYIDNVRLHISKK